jgi:hypothetical protein
MGSAKRALPGSAVRAAASNSTVNVVGDGVPVDGAMMWYFRVVLQSLRLAGFVSF